MTLNTTEHPLTVLFHAYADTAERTILELQNIDRKTVGALYLDQLRYKNFIVSDTNNSEKYYLYIDGIGIYFSFYKKINL